eukprot:TRINITY_DN2301_c0_g1_i1.p1 TRINITY_DN2301_c0_g1~~TRINITY_DN2301_c0_g1_i1.p1  ORF type:complete len:1030 (-),score=354.82 TRINITY_DN2301_c0_g1_i1:92-2935(-)
MTTEARLELLSVNGPPKCMGVSDSNRLSVVPCSYSSKATFKFQGTEDATTPGLLLTQSQEQAALALNVAAKKADGNIPVIVESVATSTKLARIKFSYHARANQYVFGPAIFKIDNEAYCLVSAFSEEINEFVLNALYIDESDTTSCASVRLVPFDYDVVVGKLYFGGDKKRGVRYVPNNNGTSVLQVTHPFQAGNFAYNLVTGHVHALTDNDRRLSSVSFESLKKYPLIFFWWNGPLKSYDNFDSRRSGYGFMLSSTPSSISVIDDRGFSGRCLKATSTEIGASIVADQVCSSFVFQPSGRGESKKFNSRQANAREFRSVLFSVNYKSRDYLVRIRRYARSVEVKGQCQVAGYFYAYELTPKKEAENAASSINYRFVWSETSTPVNPKAGFERGFLRWAGDPENALLPDATVVKNTQTDSDILQATGLPANTWSFAFNSDPRVAVMNERKGKEFVPTHCLSVVPCMDKLCLSMDALTSPACVKASLNTVPSTYVDGLSLVQHFDKNSITELGTTIFDPFYDEPRLEVGAEEVAEAEEEQTDSTSRKLLALGTRTRGSSRRTLQQVMQQTHVVANPLSGLATDFAIGDTGRFGLRRVSLRGRPVLLDDRIVVTCTQSVVQPFVPISDLTQKPYGLVSVRFQAEADIPTTKTYSLFNFRRSSGCVVFVTGAGDIGLRCDSGSKPFVRCQSSEIRTSSGRLNLLSGSPYTVSLLYSTDASQPMRVFIDSDLALECSYRTPWRMESASSNLIFGRDQANWEFAGFAGSLYSMSVWAATSYEPLLAKAKAGAAKKIVSVKLVPTVQTTFKCSPEADENSVSFSCTVRSNSTMQLSSLFLACSRPHCSITFAPNQPDTGKSFSFDYIPGSPARFGSENVGKSKTVDDPSVIFDGFDYAVVSSRVTYKQDPTAQSKLELALGGHSEDRFYMISGSCCYATCDKCYSPPPDDGSF